MNKVLVLIAIHFTLAVSAQEMHSFVLGKTIGKYPFLEYGLGDDRLGGAKMTYLDSDIVMRIIDSVNTDYKVQLSANHVGYIARESVELLRDRNLRPYYLTGNIRVSGDSISDLVSIQLEERLPYRSLQMIHPSRIAVDIFGVNANTNWITQLRTRQEITNTWYEQIEDDVMRVYIELKHAQHWGHSIYYDSAGTRLNIRVWRQPKSLDIKKMRIAIDAGHGGENAGASGLNSRILEKDYTLLMAIALQKQLQKAGVKNIFMTRTSDTTLSMIERLDMLKSYHPDFLISMHLNSSSQDTVSGTSTYYRYIGYRPLSESILKRMLEIPLKEFGNVGQFNFALNGPTAYPNCLVEVAFLSNPADEKKILDPAFHRSVARKIQEGIKDWLKTIK